VDDLSANRDGRGRSSALLGLLVAASVVITAVLPPASLASTTQPGGDGDTGAAVRDVPVVTIAGDIATSGPNDEATAALIERIDPDYVLTAGDNTYDDGTQRDYELHYEPSWGRFKDRTRPTPGNHDYRTQPPYYYTYFADQLPAENAGRYYAFDVGDWRLYSLNCERGVDCSSGSAQAAWLEHDLATAGAGRSVLAYLHRPRYSCGATHGSSTIPAALWDVLIAARADVVIGAHDHHYERFARMDNAGRASATGPLSFVVGTGGAPLRGFDTRREGCALSQHREHTAYGVLELALGAGDVSWRFVTTDDAVLDAGTAPLLGEAPPVTFRDVTEGEPHAAAIHELAAVGILAGYPDGSFRPRGTVTRGQLATYLARTLGLPGGDRDAFSDLAGSVHAGNIGALAAAGLLQGYPDGTFGPDDPVRRDQAASVLSRWLQLESPGHSPFEDLGGTVHRRAIEALHGAGIVQGLTADRFGPAHGIRRDQLATTIVRARTVAP
jgi:hypothetical protein